MKEGSVACSSKQCAKVGIGTVASIKVVYESDLISGTGVS